MDFQQMDELIDKVAERPDLTPEDLVMLTIARRLNRCSDNTLAEALSGNLTRVTKRSFL